MHNFRVVNCKLKSILEKVCGIIPYVPIILKFYRTKNRNCSYFNTLDQGIWLNTKMKG